MASNLSTIGFTFSNDGEFQDTMLRLAEKAREFHACPPGEYAIWRSRTGAEIWFHLPPAGTASDSERAIEGLTPFFEGAQSVQLVLTGAIHRPGYNAFEGAFQAQFGGTGDGAGVPLVFDAVNFAGYAERKLPARLKVKLTGFGRKVTMHASEAAYFAAQTSEPVLAARSFVPIGMLSASRDAAGREQPSSSAALTGKVTAARQLTNEATGRPFHWMTIETFSATLDVVADPEVVSGEIVTGATAEVICVLFGRILD